MTQEAPTTAEEAYRQAFQDGATHSAEGPLNLAKALGRQFCLTLTERDRLKDLILQRVHAGELVRRQQSGIVQMFTYRTLRDGEQPQPAPSRHQQGRRMVYRTAS